MEGMNFSCERRSREGETRILAHTRFITYNKDTQRKNKKTKPKLKTAAFDPQD